MRFDLSQDQEDLRDVIRGALQTLWPREELVGRSASDGAALWSRLGIETDVLGLAVPEDLGGVGGSLVEVAVVAREFGRALYSGPFLSSWLAVTALSRVKDPAAEGLLTAALRGETAVTVVGFDPAGDAELVAEESGGSWVVSGHASGVLDATSAQSYVVVAESAEGKALFLVDRAQEVTISTPQPLDLGRPVSRVEFAGASATRIDAGRSASEVTEYVWLVAQVALAAEQIGGAETCLDIAVEHAKRRVQFGQPIGSFQAIKHRCATTALAIEAARAAMWNASWETSNLEGAPGVTEHVSMARAAASDAFAGSAESAIQVLGGVGFTWEHPTHLYYRRALAYRHLFGSAAYHRERVARSLFGVSANH